MSELLSRHAGNAFEHDMQVLPVLESAESCSPFGRQLSCQKQFASTFDLDVPNLFLGRTTKIFSQLPLKRTALD